MEYINFLGMLISIALLGVTIVLAPIFWFRAAKNMLKVWRHVKPEALEKHPGLRINRFNAMFYPGALDMEGREARNLVFTNSFKFIALILGVLAFSNLWVLVT